MSGTRHEAEHATQAVDNAVRHQGCGESLRQGFPQETAHPCEPVFKPFLRVRAHKDDQVEHGVEHGQHDCGTPDAVGKHFVQFVRQAHAGALFAAALQAVARYIAAKGEALHGDDVLHAPVLGLCSGVRLFAQGAGGRFGLLPGGVHGVPGWRAAFQQHEGHPAGRGCAVAAQRVRVFPFHQGGKFVQYRIQQRPAADRMARAREQVRGRAPHSPRF